MVVLGARWYMYRRVLFYLKGVIETMITPTLGTILQLSVAERIQLVEDIWDSIVAMPESLPVTEAQQQELDRRLEAHRANPTAGVPWHEVKKRIRSSR